MEIKSIKERIVEIHEVWNVLGDSVECFKYGEIHESFVVEIISDYCISKGYDVEGFPMQKGMQEKNHGPLEEDYFCYTRYLKYLDVLATQHDDVLDLMYFYSSTFWPELFNDKQSYKERLLDYISCNVYEIAF